MNRKALLAITFVSVLATPFVVQAMPPAQGSATASAPAALAAAVPAPVRTITEPDCTRKVKVVYAGYGEGSSRGCSAQAAAK